MKVSLAILALALALVSGVHAHGVHPNQKNLTIVDSFELGNHPGKKDLTIVDSLVQGLAGFGKSVHRFGASLGNNNEVSSGLQDKTETGGAPCQDDSYCGGTNQGTCNLTTTHNVTTGKCVCDERYADVDCSYKRKNGNLAGGLQFLCFVGIGGVGNFVLGRTGAAVGQLLLMLAPLLSIVSVCCMGCGALCGAGHDSDNGFLAGIGLGYGCAICSIFTLTCAAVAGFIWCIVTAAIMLSGDMLDGNGYRTYPLGGP